MKNYLHMHADTYTQAYIYYNAQVIPFDTSTSKTFKKKADMSQLLLSLTLAFRPNTGPAALMTDPQDLSK